MVLQSETKSDTEGPKSPVAVKGSVNGLCCSVCVVLTSRCALHVSHESHPCDTASSQAVVMLFAPCLVARSRHPSSHISTSALYQHHNGCCHLFFF